MTIERGLVDPDPEHRLLIVSPHADDEVLGCGGLIAKAIADGAYVEIVYGGVGGSHPRHLDREPSTEERTREIIAVQDILGFQRWSILHAGLELRLDTIPQTEIIQALDAIIDVGRFTEVYFCYPSHHQDHQAIHDAVAAALRPGAHPSVKLIALYEYVYPGWFQVTAAGGRMYVDISDVLELKERAWDAYVSQQRPPPSPLANGVVRTVAMLRGLECCAQYAELFHVLHVTRAWAWRSSV